jgi:hypothetical protein
MPAKYEAIRDQSIKEGLSTKMAKQKAARIFNAQRPEGAAPVTRSSDSKPAKPTSPPFKKGAP